MTQSTTALTTTSRKSNQVINARDNGSHQKTNGVWTKLWEVLKNNGEDLAYATLGWAAYTFCRIFLKCPWPPCEISGFQMLKTAIAAHAIGFGASKINPELGVGMALVATHYVYNMQ